MLQQVLKHLKTLVKYLSEQRQKTSDPTVIEQVNRQIKSIEKLRQEVKLSMRASKKSAQRESANLETFFLMSAEESGPVSQRHSIDVPLAKQKS